MTVVLVLVLPLVFVFVTTLKPLLSSAVLDTVGWALAVLDQSASATSRIFCIILSTIIIRMNQHLHVHTCTHLACAER